jgi:antibiotic biosynthesis monooxygenase (ABM) superfamily enzyme
MSFFTKEMQPMSTIPWYKSKLVWLGVIMTVLGILPLISSLLSQTTVAPSDFVGLLGGILTVILRIWFTDTAVDTPKAQAKIASEAQDKQV